MSLAPKPSREELRWYPPTPLRPDVRVTTHDLRGTELGDAQLRIKEPDPRRDFLPGWRQFQLNGAARRFLASVADVEQPVRIQSYWQPPGVTARWWPINRFHKDCWPLFVVSNPVLDRKTAFVAVRAEHWGTLYALEKTGDRWTPTAEWSRWIY
jgi:hypothetical protein